MTFQTDILCSFLFGGTVGPGAAGEITTLVDLEGKTPLNCTLTEKGFCTEANGSLVLFTLVDLPWKTEMLLGTPFLDDISAHAGGGAPGYLFECSTIIGKVDDTCSGSTSTEEINVVVEFKEYSAKTKRSALPGTAHKAVPKRTYW
jgi:hypothetical protein